MAAASPREGISMNLTSEQRDMLTDVGLGIIEVESFMAELTDYHGDAVTVEYLLTVEIAKALLRRSHPDVRLEYVINQILHLAVRDRQKKFTLGSRRFDVAVIDQAAAKFAVEAKIRVRNLSGAVEKDLVKIIDYLDYLKCSYAKGVLGICVFQIHETAPGQKCLHQTTLSVHAIEQRIKNDLATFAVSHPSNEFAWVDFQSPNGRIYDDEETTDVDDVTPMLGRKGYACRYHAILIRRLCGALPSRTIEALKVY